MLIVSQIKNCFKVCVPDMACLCISTAVIPLGEIVMGYFSCDHILFTLSLRDQGKVMQIVTTLVVLATKKLCNQKAKHESLRSLSDPPALPELCGI